MSNHEASTSGAGAGQDGASRSPASPSRKHSRFPFLSYFLSFFGDDGGADGDGEDGASHSRRHSERSKCRFLPFFLYLLRIILVAVGGGDADCSPPESSECPFLPFCFRNKEEEEEEDDDDGAAQPSRRRSERSKCRFLQFFLSLLGANDGGDADSSSASSSPESPECPLLPLCLSLFGLKDEDDDGAAQSSRRRPERPSGSRYRQQELPSCKPILTPGWVVATFLAIAVVFVPIGVATLRASHRVVEINYRYDDACVPCEYRFDKVGFIQSSHAKKKCMRSLTVPKLMKSPVFIYYQLENYFQNHRRYANSRSYRQMRHPGDEGKTNPCKYKASANNAHIVPCGLIAWSLFNDTYRFFLDYEELCVNKQDIVWKTDREEKFGPRVYPKNFQNSSLIGGAKLDESIPLSEQVDLMVWMRPAALSTFRKLYGKIEVDLQAGDEVNVIMENNYNTYSFDGKKSLVLSTTSWIGGKNDFLGVAYIVVGGYCSICAAVFSLFFLFIPRSLGDLALLSWNRNSA